MKMNPEKWAVMCFHPIDDHRRRFYKHYSSRVLADQAFEILCQKYPNYEVTLIGCNAGPDYSYDDLRSRKVYGSVI